MMVVPRAIDIRLKCANTIQKKIVAAAAPIMLANTFSVLAGMWSRKLFLKDGLTNAMRRPRSFEQNFRVDMWNICRGYAATRNGSFVK
jgi:hypothetical protein